MTSLRSILAPSSLLFLLAGCGDSPAPVDGGTVDAGSPVDSGSPIEVDASSADAATTDDAGTSADAATSLDAGSVTDGGATGDGGPVADNAFIARVCGPADGLAIQLTLSDALDATTCGADPLRPSTVFYVHGFGGATLPPTSGSTLTSTAAASNGSATECPGGRPPCRVSDDWTLTFSSYTEGGAASGQYTITWIGGGTSSGAFGATTCEMPLVCG